MATNEQRQKQMAAAARGDQITESGKAVLRQKLADKNRLETAKQKVKR